jgi:hypothetical protein
MTIQEAIKARHSVRSYTDRKIPAETISLLKAEIDACNRESGLHIQLVTNEPKAFDGMMAHYGKFTGVQNYIALIGKKTEQLEERVGYYGERLALSAQTLGLNSCWVAMTFSKGTVKKSCTIDDGEKLSCVLALGYGTTEGVSHKSKPMETLCKTDGSMPDWFKAGMEAAMLAPTAVNQQKFLITLTGDHAEAKSLGGFYSMIDLGIVEYHFEIGSGKGIHPFP